MIKAFLIVATLSTPIGYETMERCKEVATKLNDIQGERIAVCITKKQYKKFKKQS